AIIGLLSTIAFISLNRARAKARDAKRISDVRQMQSALELYYNDFATPVYFTADNTIVPDNTNFIGTTYMASAPVAPTPADDPTGATDCSANTAANNSYRYHSYATNTALANGTGWYQIGFCIGGATGGLAAGCVIAEPSGMRNVATANCTLAEP
ncbi:MAG: type II secretion system protein, partial [Candidatus Kerfeldbacteria bacterium]|nr:type II secretion system protein [Candidatus Kerfeldbacteria bacterium]